MKDFRKLSVWRKAHELTLAVYRASKTFPREEAYGLTTQLRRSCASVAANLAEGCGRSSDAEFGRYCSIAMGSASETEYHLLLANDLELIEPAVYEELAVRVTEVKRMLAVLIGQLSTSHRSTTRPRAAES